MYERKDLGTERNFKNNFGIVGKISKLGYFMCKVVRVTKEVLRVGANGILRATSLSSLCSTADCVGLS